MVFLRQEHINWLSTGPALKMGNMYIQIALYGLNNCIFILGMHTHTHTPSKEKGAMNLNKNRGWGTWKAWEEGNGSGKGCKCAKISKKLTTRVVKRLAHGGQETERKNECINERVLSSLFHSIWVLDLGDDAALNQGVFSCLWACPQKELKMAFTNLQEASHPHQADSADYPARAHTTTCHNPSFPEQKPPCFLLSLPIAAAQRALQGTQPRDGM